MPMVTTLSGKAIESQSGHPVSGVSIHLLDIAGVVLRTMTSDQNGQFEFHDVQPGNYELGWSAAAANELRTRKLAVTTDEKLAIEVMI
ncbi:hypothetical protein D3C77_501810 [compost metagenome]